MALLTFETVRTLEGLEQIWPEWMRLFNEVAGATPFQSPAWLTAWWRQFGNGDLWTVTIRDKGKLIGLFPFYSYEDDSGQREFKFMGAGISDYLDVLIAPGFEKSVCDVFEFLADCVEERVLFNLEQVRRDSALLQVGSEADRVITEAPGCLCAALPETVEAWQRSLPENLLRDIRSSGRRVQGMGRLSFECATTSNLDQFLPFFFSLHAARWEARGQPGVLADPVVQAFHREAAAELLGMGMLRLWILAVNGQPVSGVYGFSHRRRLYIYLTGFDPQFAKFSLGSFAIGTAIEEAIHEGCREVDFLRGLEPYKFRFGATKKPMVSLRCSAEGLRRALIS